MTIQSLDWLHNRVINAEHYLLPLPCSYLS